MKQKWNLQSEKLYLIQLLLETTERSVLVEVREILENSMAPVSLTHAELNELHERTALRQSGEIGVQPWPEARDEILDSKPGE